MLAEVKRAQHQSVRMAPSKNLRSVVTDNATFSVVIAHAEIIRWVLGRRQYEDIVKNIN